MTGCGVCGALTPIMICQKVPGTYAEYEWFCRKHWNERYGR